MRIEVVPHGTEFPDAADAPSDEPCPVNMDSPFVLCLSRIHPIKRLDLAIRAFAALSSTFDDLQLVIAGNDAGALAGLRQLAREMQVQDRCHFTGFVSGAAKARAYCEARLFLHPSDHENFGLSVVEAMACGCPVVTTTGVASGVYVEQAEAGLVVPSGVNTVADAMQILLSQPRDLHGPRGARFVEQHLTWPRIADQLSRLYESIVVPGQVC